MERALLARSVVTHHRDRGDHRDDDADPKPLTPCPSRSLPLHDSVGAVEIELTGDDLREIESAASQIEVQGARYPEHLEQMTGR
jgi:hypothetical protein